MATVSLAERNSVKREEPCCVCRVAVCVRIRLRNCGHVVCVSCTLTHLQYFIQIRAKVVIPCPMGACTHSVHENDVDAVLDEKEEGLNVFMSLEHRKWLLYVHRKDGIILALAGRDPLQQKKFIRQCPGCRSIYLRSDGCHAVTCANLRCGTKFCWQCAKPIKGMSHFAGGLPCTVSHRDVDRSFFFFRAARDVRTFAVFFDPASSTDLCSLPLLGSPPNISKTHRNDVTSRASRTDCPHRKARARLPPLPPRRPVSLRFFPSLRCRHLHTLHYLLLAQTDWSRLYAILRLRPFPAFLRLIWNVSLQGDVARGERDERIRERERNSSGQRRGTGKGACLSTGMCYQ